MSLNDLNSKLTPRQVEIAIEAIGRRATGSPAEAAAQILLGIAVLESGGTPAVAWPEEWAFLDKARWHAQQANHAQQGHECLEDIKRSRLARLNGPHPHAKRPDQAEPLQSPEPAGQAREAHHGAQAEPGHASTKKPDQVANDASE